MRKSNSNIDVLLTWPRDGIRLFESMIPLGTCIMATFLRDNGFRVKIIDFNNYWRDFEEDLLHLSPAVVLVGGTTNTRMDSFRTMEKVKRVLPRAVTVFGGHHATYTARDTLLHRAEVDYVISGEGEFAALALCQALLRKVGRVEEVSGLSYRSSNGIVSNPPARIDDLSILPIADRSLFEHRYPMSIDFFDLPADYILTSRGCLATCDFCSAVKMYPGGVRLEPMDKIEREIQSILSQNPSIKGLKIFDSTFTAVRSHVESFCAMIEKYNLIWECEIRVDTVDRELLQMMRNAGCVYINFGIETASVDTMQKIHKGITITQVECVIEWAHELEIKTKAFFTFGHLGESYSECLKTVRYMNSLKGKIDFFATTVGMRVYPGTDLEHKVHEAGLLPSGFSWASYTPGLRNWLLLEPTNIFILSQPQLPLWKLSLILLKLFKQNTILSPAYIKKMVGENIQVVGILLKLLFLKGVFALKRQFRI